MLFRRHLNDMLLAYVEGKDKRTEPLDLNTKEIILNTEDGVLCVKDKITEDYLTYMKKEDGLYWLIDKNHYKGEKLFIVPIGGGLGNQIIQYAFYLYLKQLGVDAHFDKCLFEGLTSDRILYLRSYALNWSDCASSLQSIICKYVNYENQMEAMKTPIPSVFNRRYAGYWQQWKYLGRVTNTLRKDVVLTKEAYESFNQDTKDWLKTISEQDNSISIHVRRGDYVKLQHTYVNLTPEWYVEAVKKMIDKTPELSSGREFYIFSDDWKWCEREVVNKIRATVGPNDSVFLVEFNVEKDAVADFELMRRCKHHIIANSSFSWMASLLCDNKDKVVIGPRKWHNTKDVVFNFGMDTRNLILFDK